MSSYAVATLESADQPALVKPDGVWTNSPPMLRFFSRWWGMLIDFASDHALPSDLLAGVTWVDRHPTKRPDRPGRPRLDREDQEGWLRRLGFQEAEMDDLELAFYVPAVKLSTLMIAHGQVSDMAVAAYFQGRRAGEPVDLFEPKTVRYLQQVSEARDVWLREIPSSREACRTGEV